MKCPVCNGFMEWLGKPSLYHCLMCGREFEEAFDFDGKLLLEEFRRKVPSPENYLRSERIEREIDAKFTKGPYFYSEIDGSSGEGNSQEFR